MDEKDTTTATEADAWVAFAWLPFFKKKKMMNDDDENLPAL
jgi:hypothetical protein